MAKAPTTASHRKPLAEADDLRRILGDLDETKIIDILALRPTVRDVEDASLWLAGDPDIFGAGKPLKPKAGEIVGILTANEEEEPRQAI